MPLTSGTRLGPYGLVAPLGAGRMGEVYKGRDTRLARDVAIKVLPAEVADRERLARFEQKARSASALNHPNIVAVYESGAPRTEKKSPLRGKEPRPRQPALCSGDLRRSASADDSRRAVVPRPHLAGRTLRRRARPGGEGCPLPAVQGEPLDVPRVTARELPIQWSPDAKFLYVAPAGELPRRVFRLDPFHREKRALEGVRAFRRAGVVEVRSIVMTPDAASYAYTYVRIRSTLYVAEGLR